VDTGLHHALKVAAHVLTAALHLGASLALAAYGFHRLRLAVRRLRLVTRASRRDPPLPDPLPVVTLQIPLYNERYVAERVILAAGALDYPAHLFEIQVLDDSTDETAAVAARAVSALRRRGLDARHLRRAHRAGFKAGALAHGLDRARGELVAIFDADFVPPPDFLRRTVGEFADPSVGMVQARWDHLNAELSLLTRTQALQLDAHFAVEHGVRAAARCFFNFNGTAGVWRRRAIVSAGGWRADTLTEDLDLSYRAQLAGWRFVYRDDVAVPGELPVEIAAYRIQQQRWAQGGAGTARMVLPTLLRSGLSARVKWEAFWHLTGSCTYPLLLLLGLAGLAFARTAGPIPAALVVVADGMLLAFATASLAVFYGVAAYLRSGLCGLRRLALLPAIMLLGAGIAPGQAAAVLRGLRLRRTPFLRTPKYRLENRRDESWRSARYRLPLAGLAAGECLAGAVVLALTAWSVLEGGAAPIGIGLILGAGLVAVGGGALLQGAAPR
jgi:cellulose synthase/poly-beta-1,6-N-acetylglucosamine synthase-like glycosyltransferase